MARKVGQIIARGDRRWLIRVYLGRDQTWSRSTLLHQRGSALADFLELHFKATKLLRA